MNRSPAAAAPMSPFRVTLAIVLALAGAASGQEPALAPEVAAVRIRGSDVRDVENMRQGPMRLVGIEEGDGSFRSGTPALERARGQAVPVDDAWLYQRKLAMFENGGIHHQPAPSRALPPEAIHGPRRLAPSDAADRRLTAWLLMGATMLAACLAFIVWRNRQTRRVDAVFDG